MYSNFKVLNLFRVDLTKNTLTVMDFLALVWIEQVTFQVQDPLSHHWAISGSQEPH